MAAATREYDTPTSNYDYPVSMPQAAAKIWNGTLVSFNAAGFAIAASDTADTRVMGRANATSDNTGGAAGAVNIEVLRGIVELDNPAGANQLTAADRGKNAYVLTDHEVCRREGTVAGIPAGVVLAVDTVRNKATIDCRLVIAGSEPQATPNGAVSPAGTPAAQEEVLAILLPDAATTSYDYVMPFKAEIIDCTVIKDAAGAGNTLQLFNSVPTAISDAIAAAVDKAVTRAGTLDKATRVLAAGAILRFTNTRAAGSSALAAFVKVIRRP